MMKVIDKSQNKVQFCTIPNGYVFEADGELYMAIRPYKVSDVLNYNAVCLTDGLLYPFKPNAEVIPCLAQIEIIKKGSYAQ
jgi:hypothetical protein